jgi:hypothetical protein
MFFRHSFSLPPLVDFFGLREQQTQQLRELMEFNHSLAGYFFSRFLLVGLFSSWSKKKENNSSKKITIHWLNKFSIFYWSIPSNQKQKQRVICCWFFLCLLSEIVLEFDLSDFFLFL